MSNDVDTQSTPRTTLRRAEAAARFGVSAWFIDRLIRDGTLKARKVGRCVLIDRQHAEHVLGGGQ